MLMDQQSIAAQYATSANLAARIVLHELFSTNPYPFQRWVFDRLNLSAGQRVLEVACGTGSLWRENLDRIPTGVHLILSDFSAGMLGTSEAALKSAMPDARFVACALPDLAFIDGACDLVVANHMLYHLQDRVEGLREIRRLLRRGGALVAVTNGCEHLREIKDLMRQFGIDPGHVSDSFTLENGEPQLGEVFQSIRRDDYPNALRVTDSDLLLAYIASLGSPAREIVDARRDEMRAAVESRIARDGAFKVVKSTGLFVAAND
ncbi:MAG: methyltransferase domain-containing protein [Acidobacteria bacterium]|nr:methyltransferase domain-containing protein [Acidobacteriota bacterium]